MINSVNALELLKPKLLTMDKYNSTPTAKLFPPSSLTQSKTFVTISSYQPNNATDPLQEKQSQFLLKDEIKHRERVKVQHLESHTKLQNNKCWNNFRTLYNVSASPDVSGREMLQMRQIKDKNEIDVVNIEHLTSTPILPLNIQDKSAFNLDLNTKHHNSNNFGGISDCNNLKINYSKTAETNNNQKFYCKQYNKCSLIYNQLPTTSMILMSTEPQPTSGITTISQRTEDQNNAYRHIESVHNYAKSKSFEGDDDDNTSPNGSRHSSYLDDDEDDDDDVEDNDDDPEYDIDDHINYGNPLEANVNEIPNNLDADYEDIFSKQRFRNFQKLSTSTGGGLSSKTHKIIRSREGYVGNILKDRRMQHIKVNNKKINGSNDDDEVQIDIDVETVESQSSPYTPVLNTTSLLVSEEAVASVKPDHHARRPMNAFLIFCKRHRSIVKERYKNLENRAITKILGDWWASLDINDKKCFTNLAQQNKDAFFSANPNFKWYKLPAPPLRTLTTRPANAYGQEYHDDKEACALEVLNNNAGYSSNQNNYFKLADETQMGDLNQLMQDKSKTTKQCVDLQQALGETSEFMSAHITGNSEAVEENHIKRRYYNENSYSSNSSEEDAIERKKKRVRSCKGKIYQELINSGQIATSLKKTKSSARSIGGDDSEIGIKQNFSNAINFNNSNLSNNDCQKRSASELENVLSYDLNGFDLEERIKELPALNLDDYLQRKRNTKKKKKFSSNGKKRGQRSNASRNNDNLLLKTTQIPDTGLPHEYLLQQHHLLAKQQAATAVGSQKRKARKESITRRDVSAIEKEVASLLPLTINGCCYFQEAPVDIKFIKEEIEYTEEVAAAPSPYPIKLTSTSLSIPSKQSFPSSVSNEILNNTNTNTSDLLILAEVAANRTELKH